MSALTEALLGEIQDLVATVTERRDDAAVRFEADLAELQTLQAALQDGRPSDDARMRVRALKQRHQGEEGKRGAQMKAQDVRVRMRAPQDLVGSAPPPVKSDRPVVKPGLSRVVVLGSIQRELGQIDQRIVELLVDEGESKSGPEVCFLTDLRAGLIAVQKQLPEHDVLLNLVNEHVDAVEATFKDLRSGGIARARRFFEHDRELLGRLKAMVRADGQKKGEAEKTVQKLSESLQKARKTLEAPPKDLSKVSRELEDTLLTIHKVLQDGGFVAARSLLFSALRT
jgi:hypothetical protein